VFGDLSHRDLLAVTPDEFKGGVKYALAIAELVLAGLPIGAR
jgi:hypothetical protein